MTYAVEIASHLITLAWIVGLSASALLLAKTWF